MYLNPLGLTAVASSTDEAIEKTTFGSGMHFQDLTKQTTLTISNGEVNDIKRIFTFLEESCLLIKGVGETIKNVAKMKHVVR